MEPKNLFDRDEMIRLSREGMENTMKFYLSFNENILKMAEMQRDAMNEGNRKAIETVNKAFDEYQKHNRVILHQIEENVKNLTEKVTPKAETKTKTHGS